jgi:hypothetical protein
VTDEIDKLLASVQTGAAEKVTYLIVSGSCDDDLDMLELAVRQRRLTVAGLPRDSLGYDSNLVPLFEGDKVFFNNQCSPQYLRGTLGKVVGKYGKKLKVEVDDVGTAKSFKGETVTVIPDIITKV